MGTKFENSDGSTGGTANLFRDDFRGRGNFPQTHKKHDASK